MLGKTIAEGGRESVAPLIRALSEGARNLGLMRFDDAEDTADVYINVLIGDLQIQRVIGALRRLTPGDSGCNHPPPESHSSVLCNLTR